MLLSNVVSKLKLIDDNLQNNNHQVTKVSMDKGKVLIETLKPIINNSNLSSVLNGMDNVQVEFDYFITVDIK
jgi:hypothetical protein